MVPNLKNILKISKKEFLAIFKDQGLLLIMVGAIFLYGIFYLVPFHLHETRNVPIGVIDNDNSSLSREFLRDLNAHANVKIVEELSDIENGKTEYYKNRIRGFIVIPKDFEKNIKRGNSAAIVPYTDSAFLIFYKQIATAVSGTSNYFGSLIEINSLMKKGINKEKALSIVSPINLVSNPLYNPIGSYQNYIYPMVLIMILQQTLLIGASMKCATDRERLQGIKINENDIATYQKINGISEFSNNPVEIVLGKSFAYVFLYSIYSLLYFLVFPAIAVYKMTYNIGAMLLVLIPFLFSCAFLGISLTFFCKKREYSTLIMIPTSVPFIFLPGFVWAKEAIPPALYFMSKLIPFESAADGLVKINQMGANFNQVLPDFYILLGLCILYFICACITIEYIQKSRD